MPEFLFFSRFLIFSMIFPFHSKISLQLLRYTGFNILSRTEKDTSMNNARVMAGSISAVLHPVCQGLIVQLQSVRRFVS